MSRTDLSHWIALWRDLGAEGDAAPWHHRLVAAYGESARHYHTFQHLDECLAELTSARDLARQPAVLAIALWFHDAVYDARSATNEADSAQLAADCLRAGGIAAPVIATVQELILATKTHEAGDNPDAALLIDIDLAILGQPRARFWDYEHAIRAEYAWVPATIFAEKRAEILARFLARPALYHTAQFRSRYEAAARANLAAAIARLRNHAP